jgi:hypothetical protein
MEGRMVETGFPAQNLPEREETYRYHLRPRPKPQYHSVVDPQRLFGGAGRQGSVALFRTWTTNDSGSTRMFFHTRLELPEGVADEQVGFGIRERLVVTESVERKVFNAQGRLVRDEHVDFHQGPYQFPLDLVPEVYAPFLMRVNPAPPQRRSFHSWISDRFVARIWYELRRKRVTVEVPAGRIECSEILMYPDLNDWVPLGNVLMALAKPLLPSYHVWLALDPPHPVIRFEGAYGPPGAPEVVVELLR